MKAQLKNSVSGRKSDRGLLKHIHDISYLLTQSLDLNAVLNEIVDHVVTGLKYDRAIVMLLNEDETKLECKCIRGFTPLGEKRAWEKPLILNRHDCFETRVVRSGKPLFIQDIAKDPNITEIDRITAKYQERKSLLHVPLKVKDKVLGTIGVDRYRTKMKISQREFEDLAIFANQAAIIIENARLYKELKDEKLLSENIIKSSINGIIVSDLRGRIIHLNPRAEEILGLRKEEAVRLHLQEIFNGDVGNMYEKLITKGNSRHFEINYQRQDGEKLILDLAPFPLEETDKVPSKTVLLINDLTEKRRIDEHLMRVEKFAALGSMAAGIAHEIRNPMAAIFTTIQHVETKLEKSSPHKHALQNVTKELDRIERLIRELLNTVNPFPLHMEKVDVMDLLERALFFIKKKSSDEPVARIFDQPVYGRPSEVTAGRFTIRARQITFGVCCIALLHHYLGRNPFAASPQLQEIVCSADEFPFLGTGFKPPAHKVSDTAIVFDLAEDRFHGLPSFFIKLSASLGQEFALHPLSGC